MYLTYNFQLIGETYCGNFGYGDVYIRLYARLTGQSIPNNQSYIELQSRIYLDSGQFNTSSIYSNVDGEQVGLGSLTFYTGETTLQTVGRTLTHNGDGTLYNVGKGASWSSYWSDLNGSTSGSFNLPQIPRYASVAQSLSSKTETNVVVIWSSDSIIDYFWYSKDNGATWVGVDCADSSFDYFELTGLSPNTTYNIKTRVRRMDSQLTTDSSTLSVTTYAYPYITSISAANLVVGSAQTVNLYNPLSRSVTVRMTKVATGSPILYSGTTSGTSLTFTPVASTLYNSIPNNTSASALYHAIYSVSDTTYSGTYSINTAICAPTFTAFTYKDVRAETLALTADENVLINNFSTCQFAVNLDNRATAINGATMSKYVAYWGSKSVDMTYYSGQISYGQIAAGETNTLKIVAIDSRGLSTTVTATNVKIVQYNSLGINELDTIRLSGISTTTYLRAKIRIDDIFWNTVSRRNAIQSVQYRTKKIGEEFTSYFDITTAFLANADVSTSGYSIYYDLPFSKNLQIHADGVSGGFIAGKQYDIELLVRDGYGNNYIYTMTKTATVTDGKVGMAKYKGSDGNYHYAINAMPEDAYTLYVNGTLKSNNIDVPTGGYIKIGGFNVLTQNQIQDNIPIGLGGWYPSITPPNGFLVCDGSAISRTTYAELFAILGTTHGAGNGTTTFNLPNIKGRTIVGIDSADTDFDVIGETRGAKTHTLDITQIPAHNHVFNGERYDDTNFTVSGGYMMVAGNARYLVNGAAFNTGGGLAHNNIQPSIVENYVIKAFKVNEIPTSANALVIDTLTSVSNIDALSANQGRVLNNKVVGVSLLDIPAGTTASAGLSSSAANFDFIDIFYNKSGCYSSVRVYNPNGKTVSLFVSNAYASGAIQNITKQVTISKSNITVNFSNYTNFSGSTVVTAATLGTDAIAITKVIGYKY